MKLDVPLPLQRTIVQSLCWPGLSCRGTISQHGLYSLALNDTRSQATQGTIPSRQPNHSRVNKHASLWSPYTAGAQAHHATRPPFYNYSSTPHTKITVFYVAHLTAFACCPILPTVPTSSSNLERNVLSLRYVSTITGSLRSFAAYKG
jgi:hypothetical protein